MSETNGTSGSTKAAIDPLYSGNYFPDTAADKYCLNFMDNELQLLYEAQCSFCQHSWNSPQGEAL
jgi:hypothetical protein